MAQTTSAVVDEYLKSLRLGAPQVLQNLIVFPIKSWLEGSPSYLGLGEALTASVLRVGEIPTPDPVPDLEIVNRARHPILMLKGEELVASGRKWAMNGTILIREDATTVIPASMLRPVRGADLIDSLADASRTPRSGRGDSKRTTHTRFARFGVNRSSVWSKIDILREPPSKRPTTDDRETIAKESQEILKESRAVFRWTPRQKGLLVCINDEPAGFDVVSQAGSFAKAHPKIVKDHVMVGLWKDGRVETHVQKATERAQQFLGDTTRCRGEQRGAFGRGFEYHCTGPGIRGTVLLYQDRVVSVAFGSVDVETGTEVDISASAKRRQ